MREESAKALGKALAGATVACATLEMLVEKKILTATEARTVLDRSLSKVSCYCALDEGYEAMRATILKMQQKLFAACESET
ncbi:MAG TPA: hypothetical protein VKV77_11095 [Methylovirgula sp.]|nr:hypothetical protein [Methylovirgula sp.]